MRAGCGTATGGAPGSGGAAPDGTDGGGTPDRARLVRADRDRPGRPDVTTGRAVHGVLRVNAAGCYAVGRGVAVAPPGSLALGDGLGVHVPALGDLRTGDRVEGVAGEVTDVGRLTAYTGCVDDRTRGVVLLL